MRILCIFRIVILIRNSVYLNYSELNEPDFLIRCLTINDNNVSMNNKQRYY